MSSLSLWRRGGAPPHSADVAGSVPIGDQGAPEGSNEDTEAMDQGLGESVTPPANVDFPIDDTEGGPEGVGESVPPEQPSQGGPGHFYFPGGSILPHRPHLGPKYLPPGGPDRREEPVEGKVHQGTGP